MNVSLHEPDKTLVIIDMQSEFLGVCQWYQPTCCLIDDIVPTICSLVRHAKNNGWAIIVVEFRDHGETDRAIHNSLVGYSHWATVYKKGMDGGKQVVDCINKHPSWPLNILVCGLYGPQCVASTVSGMLDFSALIEIDVVTDAVYPDYRSYNTKEKQREREITVDDVVGCNSPVRS